MSDPLARRYVVLLNNKQESQPAKSCSPICLAEGAAGSLNQAGGKAQHNAVPVHQLVEILAGRPWHLHIKEYSAAYSQQPDFRLLLSMRIS